MARIRLVRTFGVGLAAAALTLSGAAMATAAPQGPPPGAPHVRFLSAATVRGGGSGAVVRLAVTCPRSQGRFLLEISVQQAFSHGRPGVANGFAQGPCTGNAYVATDPVDVGQPPDNANFPVGVGELVPGSAQAVAFDYCDTGCNIDYQYPPQPVTLTDSAQLDRPTRTLDGVSAALDPTVAVVQHGHAARLTARVVCPAGQQLNLSASVGSPGTGRHIDISFGNATFTCNGRQTTVGLTVAPSPGSSSPVVLTPGAGFADLYVQATEVWGQVQVRSP
jgi:hypothetical protein